jgi:hypothetical protein
MTSTTDVPPLHAHRYALYFIDIDNFGFIDVDFFNFIHILNFIDNYFQFNPLRTYISVKFILSSAYSKYVFYIYRGVKDMEKFDA